MNKEIIPVIEKYKRRFEVTKKESENLKLSNDRFVQKYNKLEKQSEEYLNQIWTLG